MDQRNCYFMYLRCHNFLVLFVPFFVLFIPIYSHEYSIPNPHTNTTSSNSHPHPTLYPPILSLIFFFLSLCLIIMTTLSEAYRDHPLHLHHIAPLDFAAVQTMPDSHVWRPESDNDFSFQEELPPDVPIIDLADPNASELIRHACETWGVFQLVNHGVSLSLLEEVENEAGRFFALPAPQKLKALRTPCGATGYGVARITPFFSKYMWHEGFTIIGSPVDHVRELWPHDHERFW